MQGRAVVHMRDDHGVHARLDGRADFVFRDPVSGEDAALAVRRAPPWLPIAGKTKGCAPRSRSAFTVARTAV